MKRSSLFTATNITKAFRDERGRRSLALEDISIDIKAGEFVAIVGPSGCGKSTFLRIVAGLMPTDSGQLERSKDIRQAMVFQNAAIFPWLTVWDNIAFGLKMRGAPQHNTQHIVQRELEQMGLEHAIWNHPKELSGGMKQRVGIARALAVEPNFLLLDEPFSALDAFTAEKLRHDVLRIWEQQRQSVLMVTHLIEEAVEMADRIVVLSDRPGRVKKIIDVDLKRPRNIRSHDFYQLVDSIRDLVVHE